MWVLFISPLVRNSIQWPARYSNRDKFLAGDLRASQMSKCLCFLFGWQWLIIMNSLFPPRKKKQSYRITENNLQAHGSVFHHRRSMGIVSSRCHWLRRCWRHSFGLCRWQTATHLEPWMRSFLSFREAGCFVKDMGQMPAQNMFNYSIFATVNARNWSKDTVPSRAFNFDPSEPHVHERRRNPAWSFHILSHRTRLCLAESLQLRFHQGTKLFGLCSCICNPWAGLK